MTTTPLRSPGSFLATLECKLIDRCALRNHSEARVGVFDYVKAFNNPRHRHSFTDYLNGGRAICCLIHASNTLRALLRLLVRAAHPYLVRDTLTRRTRFPSGAEATARLDAEAIADRNSDPLLVESVVRFATENRPIALEQPFGIYIRGLQLHELAQPDGSDVSEDWVHLERGLGPEDSGDERP